MRNRTRVAVALIAWLAASAPAIDDVYVGAAVGAAHWIEGSARPAKDGVVWPADPADPTSVNTTLYAGTPGPILLFLELYRETGDSANLKVARAGVHRHAGRCDVESGFC